MTIARHLIATVAAAALLGGFGVAASVPSVAQAAQRSPQRITMKIPDRTLRVGQKVVIKGRVSPHRAGKKVKIYQTWLDATHWKRIKTIRTKRGGYYRTTVKLTSSRDRRIRVRVVADRRHKARTSRSLRLRIAPNISDALTVTKEVIPHGYSVITDPALAVGTQELRSPGADGLKEVTRRNGLVVKTVTLVAPVNAVIATGPSPVPGKQAPWGVIDKCEMWGPNMAVVSAYTWDPDNVGYKVTLTVSGVSLTFEPDVGNSHFSSYASGVTSATNCTITMQ